jgi:DnaJ family protein C protein 2
MKHNSKNIIIFPSLALKFHSSDFQNIFEMASIATLPLTLTAPPTGYTKPSPSKLSSPSKLPYYQAGPSFISSARRQILQRSFAQDDEAQAHLQSTNKVADEEVLYPGLGEEEEAKELLMNDPKEWKKQDHYAVLGLGGLRYLANDEQIKVARELFWTFS